MTREEIEQKLRCFMVDTLKLDDTVLRPDANLKNDIGLTSLDMIDVRLFVEKTFGWSMSLDDAVSVQTLEDLYSMIENHVLCQKKY